MTTESSTEVSRARAELTATLNSIEDRLNVPKRVKRLRDEHPGAVAAAAMGALAVLGGVVWLGVRAVRRR